jgi:pimeloyl-ACP methyl ester carboxylesterase
MFGSKAVFDRVRVQDQDIAFVRRPGSEPCIVLLHGLGCSKESFAEAFEGSYFPERLTLLAPDLIGHGSSSKPDDFSYDLAEQSELVVGLLNELAIDKVAIIAHSMGNVPGLLLTQKGLDLFGYFCLEGNLTLADCSISARVAKYSEYDFVNKLFPLTPQRFRCRGSLEETAASSTAFYRSARSLVDWSASERLLPLYMDLTVEKAYFYGEESKATSVIADWDTKEVIAISGAGHFLMNDNPEMTYGEIAGRLADC